MSLALLPSDVDPDVRLLGDDDLQARIAHCGRQFLNGSVHRRRDLLAVPVDGFRNIGIVENVACDWLAFQVWPEDCSEGKGEQRSPCAWIVYCVGVAWRFERPYRSFQDACSASRYSVK